MYDRVASHVHCADHSLKFGVWIPPFPHWSLIRRAAQKIEELGFDSIWVFDPCADLFDPNAAWMEVWACLTGIATCTHRIRLGCIVDALTCQDPAQLAQQALTVDLLSSGRLTLGFDAGPASGGKAAGGRCGGKGCFETRVRVVDAMLRDQETACETKSDRAEGAVRLPKPVQRPRPPLLIGGQGPEAVGTAARHADIWHWHGGIRETPAQRLTKAAESTAALVAAARAVGRDPETIRRAHCLGWTETDLVAGTGAFQDLVVPLLELGFTEFLLGFWKESDMAKAALIHHLPNAGALEWVAKVAIPSLRSVVQAL